MITTPSTSPSVAFTQKSLLRVHAGSQQYRQTACCPAVATGRGFDEARGRIYLGFVATGSMRLRDLRVYMYMYGGTSANKEPYLQCFVIAGFDM